MKHIIQVALGLCLWAIFFLIKDIIIFWPKIWNQLWGVKNPYLNNIDKGTYSTASSKGAFITPDELLVLSGSLNFFI